MSPIQAQLDRAMAKVQGLWPKTVRLSLAPTTDLAANVGEFRRQRLQSETGFVWIVAGRVSIRREVLAAAGITTPPASGQTLRVPGDPLEYRIDFVTPDSTGFLLDCLNRS